MTEPRLRVNGDSLLFDGHQVGQYGTDLSTGRIIAVFWKPLFRKENSYALSCELYKQIEDHVRTFYIVDSGNGDVYRFPRQTYYDAPIVYGNGQRQFCPDRSENTGHWPDAEDEMLR